uniref:THAP4-like heme-binding domain-containing protein n=1 Tax=Bombyx mori TaxID=7091 RepID=A0A8R2R879_BOMMO|nr:uncharacterized protein LOC119630424 isoform X1 [Bombyx mori]XP_037875746.1 uncharacterized protein LOC119630424 isoform X2 [Bombyx mori]
MRWSPHAQFPIDVKAPLEAGIDTSEKGFLRIKPGTTELTFVVSHNFRLTSLEEGLCDTETQVILETINLSKISFAKPPFVKRIKRVFKLLSDDQLEATLYIETDTTPMSEHLKAAYKKLQYILFYYTHTTIALSVIGSFQVRQFRFLPHSIKTLELDKGVYCMILFIGRGSCEAHSLLTAKQFISALDVDITAKASDILKAIYSIL